MQNTGRFSQVEVIVTSILLGPDGGDLYPVRFVHNRTLDGAKTLKLGELIHIERGRFNKKHGRSEVELHVKRFQRST